MKKGDKGLYDRGQKGDKVVHGNRDNWMREMEMKSVMQTFFISTF